jgi:hypothetical protein
MSLTLSIPAGSDGLVGTWSPGIGDPSVVGWLTVAAYLFTAWRCRAAALRISTRMAGLAEARRERLFWLAVAVLFALLGLNKQLDLQSLLTEVGRLLARSEGWYENRRPIQYAFIVIVAAVGLLAAAFMVFLVRRSTVGAKIAAAGTALVTAFVVIRAASFHHFDQFIDSELLGLRANWLLELTGIAVVLYATVAQERAFRRR